MSLSFVSSAVLKSTDGVSHNEETPIESPQVLALQKKQQQQQARPLFEQLRSNQEEEEATRQEFQRSIMRGTRALDEEDVAHLDAVAKQRQEREFQYQQEMQQEMALFRAARAATSATSVVDEDEDEDSNNNQQEVQPETQSEKPVPQAEKATMPKILVKKRRRKVEEVTSTASVHANKRKATNQVEELTHRAHQPADDEKETISLEPKVSGNGLASLLGGYASSDSEDEHVE